MGWRLAERAALPTRNSANRARAATRFKLKHVFGLSRALARTVRRLVARAARKMASSASLVMAFTRWNRVVVTGRTLATVIMGWQPREQLVSGMGRCVCLVTQVTFEFLLFVWLVVCPSGYKMSVWSHEF